MIIDILLLSIIAFARPPVEPIRTAEDQRIDEACSIYLNQGVDFYANCVAERGLLAEQQRQRQEYARRLQEINAGPVSPRVCNVGEAIRACQKESAAAQTIINSRYPSDSALAQSLQSCRAACNPRSAQVLRNYLGGCTNDISSVQQTMLTTMNNCGTTTVVSTVISQGARNLISSEMSTEVTQLSKGVRYMQVNIEGVQTYAYCAVDSSCYKTFDEAAKVSAPFLVRNGTYGNKTTSNFNEGNNPFAGNALIPNATSNVFIEDEDAEVAAGESGGIIPSNEKPPIKPHQNNVTEAVNDDANNGVNVNKVPLETSSVEGTSNIQSNDRTRQNNPFPTGGTFPVNYLPANYPVPQSAFYKGSGATYAVSTGQTEVTQGYSGGGINAFHPLGGGFIERQLNQSNSRANASDVSAERFKGAVSAANILPQQKSISLLPMANNYSGGRVMAANRTGQLSSGAPSFPSPSSEYYSRSSGIYATKQRGMNTTSCIGPQCRTKVRRAKAINCDGNPQCILALTGKLQTARRQGNPSGSEFFSNSRGLTYSVRGIASLKNTNESGGIVRGKVQDVIYLLEKSDIFKLDHEGFLVVD